uniref:MPN domain-containing protein n=1 Tax=Strigamia maritima TaxID=126957 RepID=T1J291_STRMM
MADIIVSMQAYCKVFLHAVKYPECAVNGLLLVEKPKNKETKSLYIVDAIPLFHICLGLAPMLEIALMQVDNFCKNKGLVIAGYYQANEHYRDTNPDFIAYRIIDKILENFNDSCLMMIDSQKLSIECSNSAIHLYQNLDGKWKLNKQSVQLEHNGKTLAAAASLLHAKYSRQLVDFDCHFDDVSLNWQNTNINDIVTRLL